MGFPRTMELRSVRRAAGVSPSMLESRGRWSLQVVDGLTPAARPWLDRLRSCFPVGQCGTLVAFSHSWS